MGLSFPNIPNANFTKTISKHYNYIVSLLEKVDTVDKFIIDYTKVDGQTMYELKVAIANIAHKYSYPVVEDYPDIQQELKRVYILNMSSQVEMDFNKLFNDDIDFVTPLRNEIRAVLESRKKTMYNNMLLNPTI